jgi:hypothetical protein
MTTERYSEVGSRKSGREPENEAPTRAAREGRTSVTDQSEITDRDGRLGRVVAFWTPPEIWGKGRPPLVEVVHYARHGRHAGEEGLARTLSKGWAYGVAIPGTALLYLLAWVIERPSRAAAATVLYSVLAHTGIGAWLPWPNWLP